jgi:hypothetical protein
MMSGMKKVLMLVYNNILLWWKHRSNSISKIMWEKLMAENYLQFSEIIPDITLEEAEWIREKREFLEDSESIDRPVIFEDEGGLGFYLEIDEKEKEAWIYADEYGNIDCVAYFVQEFINELRPSYIFSMTWAETCSKTLVGEFSGGWVVITADKILYGDCDNAISEAIRELEREPA